MIPVCLGIIAFLAIAEKFVESMVNTGIMSGSLYAQGLMGFQFILHVWLIIIVTIVVWSIITFFAERLREIQNNQVEFKARREYRAYPLGDWQVHEDATLDEIGQQWNATREYATTQPEDSEHWYMRMQQIIAHSSRVLRQHFTNLTQPELEKENTFALACLARARASNDTESRIRWQAVVDWIEEAIDLQIEPEKQNLQPVS